MNQAVLFCDASVKPGFCGIGICLLLNGKLITQQSRRVKDCGRNNTQGEALAILEGIKLAKKHGFKSVKVYSDSKSLVQVANTHKATRKTSRTFLKALQELKTTIVVTLKWVKGHAGQIWNCTCDRLARKATWHFSDILTIAINRLKGIFDATEALV